MSMSKTVAACVAEFESETPAAEKMLDRVVCSREQFSFRCALKVAMVAAELLVIGDREFQTAGAVMPNSFDWKLINDMVHHIC